MTDLTSREILVELPAAVAREVVTGDSADVIRPVPGVRDAGLHDVVPTLVFATSLAADGVTLILARQHIERFARRLLAAMRKTRYEELEVSYRTRDSNIRVTVRTSTDSHQVARVLKDAVDAIDAITQTGDQAPLPPD
jgi:hypothetical protein